MKWAMEMAPPMPAQLVATLTGLAYHADKHGRGAYPSVTRLAALTCKSERSVRRDLRDLEELGLLRRGDQNKAAHLPADKRPVVYDLAVERTVPKGRAGDDEVTRTSARTLASSRERGRAARQAKKGTSPNGSPLERGDVDVRPDVDVPPDVDVTSGGTWTSAATGRGRPPNQKTEPSAEPKDSYAPEPPPRDYAMDKFGGFWLIYPRRKESEEAKRAWRDAIDRGADPDDMVAAATAYARECKGKEARFIKYPATWLDKGCYLDEPDPEPQPGRHLKAVAGGYEGPWHDPDDHSAYHEGIY